MRTRNTLLVTALVGALTLLGAILFLAETPSQASAQSQPKAATAAPHPQAAAASKPVLRKASTAAAHPGQSLASLTKIEILPSSISIQGPHYNQRLLVEGTFADGHQEELTPQVTLTVSNPTGRDRRQRPFHPSPG